MTEEEQKLFRLYGKLPTHKNVLSKVQKASRPWNAASFAATAALTLRADANDRCRRQDRKYFDSGDYAMSKAGVTPQTSVGTAIPSPET